jgi:hypothetical protein
VIVPGAHVPVTVLAPGPTARPVGAAAHGLVVPPPVKSAGPPDGVATVTSVDGVPLAVPVQPPLAEVDAAPRPPAAPIGADAHGLVLPLPPRAVSTGSVVPPVRTASVGAVPPGTVVTTPPGPVIKPVVVPAGAPPSPAAQLPLVLLDAGPPMPTPAPTGAEAHGFAAPSTLPAMFAGSPALATRPAIVGHSNVGVPLAVIPPSVGLVGSVASAVADPPACSATPPVPHAPLALLVDAPPLAAAPEIGATAHGSVPALAELELDGESLVTGGAVVLATLAFVGARPMGALVVAPVAPGSVA